jgi:2-(3-amino-3-carboxypropyl)histidine synthase|tara:strand:- start:6790 stop:7404 length:615 start_codon:yes stop_codon:yes gene_type:complete
MKTLFIDTKVKIEVDKSKIEEISKKLPKNIAITYSIQYKDIAYKIKDILSRGHKIKKFSQILGCTIPKFSRDTRAILLITDGRFHGISLAYETKLPIYILEDNKLERVLSKEIEILKKRQKASYIKFLNAEKIGIIISTKQGQENIKKALDFKKKLKDKESYLFISNNIDTREFENFQIDSWVNTACPRLDMNSSMINLNKLKL